MPRIIMKDADLGAGQLKTMLSTYREEVKQGVLNLFEDLSSKIEDSAKQNAPWTDRTGQARAGLTAYVYRYSAQSVSVILYHKALYGIFLEVCNGGRYAIIDQTMLSFRPILVKELRRIITLSR